MRSIILICLIIVTGTSAAATLYRWVDEQGRVHYSDRPQEGADELNIQAAQTFKAQPVSPASAPASPTTAIATPQYQEIGIASPTQDEVLWNLGGTLRVELRIEPPLLPGHRFVVHYNGQTVSDWPAAGTSHTLQDIYRGTHTLDVSVVSAAGAVIKTGSPVTFHVKQTSIIKPN